MEVLVVRRIDIYECVYVDCELCLANPSSALHLSWIVKHGLAGTAANGSMAEHVKWEVNTLGCAGGGKTL